MSITFTCPNCSKSLKASSERVGRQAKCPRCGGSITIPQRASGTSHAAGTVAGRNQPPLMARPQADPPARSAQPRKYSRSHLVATAFLALVAGYFAGTMHPADQMLTEFVEAGNVIMASYRRPVAGPAGYDGSMSSHREGANLTADMLAEIIQAERPQLAIGEEHAAEGFSIKLADVQIGEAEADSLPDPGGDPPKTGQTLMCTLQMTNTDPQKTLRVGRRRSGRSGYFRLFDEFGDAIPAAPSTSPSADNESLEIPAGESMTYVAKFQLLDSPSDRLVLVVDLRAFGGAGRISFDIPMTAIGKAPADES